MGTDGRGRSREGACLRIPLRPASGRGASGGDENPVATVPLSALHGHSLLCYARTRPPRLPRSGGTQTLTRSLVVVKGGGTLCLHRRCESHARPTRRQLWFLPYLPASRPSPPPVTSLARCTGPGIRRITVPQVQAVCHHVQGHPDPEQPREPPATASCVGTVAGQIPASLLLGTGTWVNSVTVSEEATLFLGHFVTNKEEQR